MHLTLAVTARLTSNLSSCTASPLFDSRAGLCSAAQDGRTPLHRAAHAGKTRDMEKLLQHGVSCEVKGLWVRPRVAHMTGRACACP